ncbi:MAG TPA: DUF4350 domain-containing protein [Gemmatimonadaceae bacterium]
MASRGNIERWLTPRVVLIVAVLVVVGAVALMPRGYDGDAAPPLTSYSATVYGARGLFEILHRLGWRVQRRLVPLRAPLDTSAVYLVLDPPLPLTTNEVRDLLAAVRHGASAVVIPRAHTPLADSLHLAQSESTMMPYGVVDTTGRPDARDSLDDTLPARRPTSLSLFWRYLTPSAPLPRDTETFVAVYDRDNHVRPVVLGVRMGRGRLVVAADPLIFRNQIVRQGDAAVLDTRLIEWLTRAPGTTLVFDEYHHGYGEHGSLRHAVGRAMIDTPPGRMLTQAIVAGLILLAALGVRAIPPSPSSRVERRSPIEHAEALANAYEEVQATRTASRRLLRGLRRRHAFGARAGASDDAFLDAVRTRHPELATDAALVRRAIQRPLTPDEFLAVGLAIHHIDRTLAS